MVLLVSGLARRSDPSRQVHVILVRLPRRRLGGGCRVALAPWRSAARWAVAPLMAVAILATSCTPTSSETGSDTASSVTSPAKPSPQGSASPQPCEAGAPPKTEPSLKTVNGFLAWIAAHPSNVGFAMMRPSDASPFLEVNPNEQVPLASVHKILILVSYAEAVANGRLDPDRSVPLADIERWVLPNTNGDAHESALADWRERDVVKGSGASASVPLDEVVHAMVRYSDNAATDHVLRAVGGPAAVLATARRFGFTGTLTPPSLFGAFIAWATRAPSEWTGLEPGQQAALSMQTADATSAASAAALTLPPIETQASLAKATWLGAPREWVILMSLIERSVSDETLTGRVLSRHLEWPMEFSENAAAFEEFGTKGGDLPGIVTEASFIQVSGADPYAIVLFLHGLTESERALLLKTYTHQTFMRQLVEDPGFLQEACAALA